MGRNSASQIIWTNMEVTGGKRTTWYCQQHAKYDFEPTSFSLKTHIETEHGNVEQ